MSEPTADATPAQAVGTSSEMRLANIAIKVIPARLHIDVSPANLLPVSVSGISIFREPDRFSNIQDVIGELAGPIEGKYFLR
jgi:hypothetical protein